jgi:hypothetical protein
MTAPLSPEAHSADELAQQSAITVVE